MADDISEEEERTVREAFEQFDADQSGYLDREELGNALRCSNLNPTDDEITYLLEEVDRDGNGEIDFDEFIFLYKKNKKDPDEEFNNLVAAFKEFDEDQNGNLDRDELRMMMSTYGDPMSEEELDNFMELADKNGDGVINCGELISALLPGYEEE